MITNDFDVEKALKTRIYSLMGLDNYSWIMNTAFNANVSDNEEFQRVYNHYYRIRRNDTWQKVYYDYFELNKNNKPSFEDIITYLYERTGNVEASFASKMLATIDSTKPIWDQYVLKNLNLELKGKTQKEKLENAIRLYTEIEKWYKEFLQTQKAVECIKEFDKMFPDYVGVSDIKKIDTILWSMR